MKKIFVKKIGLVALLTMIITLAYADNQNKIPGNYQCRGYNPITQQSYTIKMDIDNYGDVFNVNWLMPNDTRFKGTGIMTKNILSVVYGQELSTANKDAVIGVVQFKITNRKLVGKWVHLNDNRVGTENCILINTQ